MPFSSSSSPDTTRGHWNAGLYPRDQRMRKWSNPRRGCTSPCNGRKMTCIIALAVTAITLHEKRKHGQLVRNGMKLPQVLVPRTRSKLDRFEPSLSTSIRYGADEAASRSVTREPCNSGRRSVPKRIQDDDEDAPRQPPELRRNSNTIAASSW